MAPHVDSEPELSDSARTRVRRRRDFEAMEERRMRTADLFRRGVISAEIAWHLGVPHQVVSELRKAWQADGRAALRGAGHAGRSRNLSTAQLAKVERVLAKGAFAIEKHRRAISVPRGSHPPPVDCVRSRDSGLQACRD